MQDWIKENKVLGRFLAVYWFLSRRTSSKLWHVFALEAFALPSWLCPRAPHKVNNIKPLSKHIQSSNFLGVGLRASPFQTVNFIIGITQSIVFGAFRVGISLHTRNTQLILKMKLVFNELTLHFSSEFTSSLLKCTHQWQCGLLAETGIFVHYFRSNNYDIMKILCNYNVVAT